MLSLLKRAFEGLGFVQGDYEDAAAMALWLELRGLYGLLAVRKAWPALGPVAALTVETQTPEHSVLAAHGASVLRVGAAAVDLVSANGSLAPRACVEVRGCRDRRLILQRLATAARRGRPLVAHWRDREHTYRVRCAHAGAEPDYVRHAAATGDEQDRATLTLICAPPDELARTAAADGPLVEHIGAAAFGHARAAALAHGLSIEARHWRFFARAADRVLVAGTEQSRRGAGE